MYILLFAPLIFFGLLNILVIYFSKKNFGISIPITLMMSTLVMYVSQLFFHTFNIGFILLLFFAAFAAILFLFKCRDEQFRKRIFTGGLYAFVIIFFFVLFIDFKRCFTTWDELSHWGKMVKEMLRLDSFYSEPFSDLLVHKEYPPFAQIFELLWCKLTGRYSEMNVTMAVHMFEFNLLIPVLIEKFESVGKNAFRKCINVFIVTIIIGLIIVNFDAADIFSTIYLDLLLPILYVFAILIMLDKEIAYTKFGYFALVVTQICLILTKQMGIAFVLLICFFYTSKIILNRDFMKWTKPKRTTGIAVLSVLLLVIPLLNYSIWSNYIRGLGINGQFDFSNINLSTLAHIIIGGGSDSQHITYQKFVSALFLIPINTGVFRLTYISATLIVLIITYILYLFFRKLFEKRELVMILLLFFFGTVGYAFSMFVLYMFCYSEGEMLNLASYDRYMGAMVLSQFLILLVLCIELLTHSRMKKLDIKIMIPILGIFIILFDTSKMFNFAPQVFKGEPLYDYRIRAEHIQNSTDTDDKIFLISLDNCQNMYYLNYYLDSRDMDDRYLYSNVADVSDNEEYWEKVVQCIGENDYLYILDASDSVVDELRQYINGSSLENDQLYKINVIETNLTLEKIF